MVFLLFYGYSVIFKKIEEREEGKEEIRRGIDRKVEEVVPV